MAKQTINVGTTANDRTGDPLRIAFTKINQNFTELYNVDANTVIISDISDLTDNSNLLFSGNYEDLANTPFIPADLSDLTDNSNLLFSGNYEDLTNTPSIPTDLSELSDTQGLLNPPLTTFTNVVLTNSPLIIVPGENFFEKEDYATGNSAIDTFILDGEYGPIGITRGNDGGIYNPYREESWDEDVSPDGILWNLESSNDLSNIQTRTFLPFYQAYGGNLENVVPGSKAIMHIPDYGKYYVIEWLSWTQNDNGGGFSYNRYEIDENQINEGVRFADGELQTTAFTTSPTLNVLKIDDGVHEKFQTKADATGTVTHDCASGHVFYHTSPDANWTANFTNLNLNTGYVTAVSLVIVQGATGYYPNAVQIGGAAQTINWQGNATPTVSSSRTDVVTFSILNNAGTYTVLGQLTGF